VTYDHPVAFSNWGPEERAVMMRVINSGRFTMGLETEAFEAEFSAFHGLKHGIMTNSGSSANLLAAESLFLKQDDPLERGDIAIVPAIAWATTYAPLVQRGLDMFISDVGDDWNMLAGANLAADLMVAVPVLGTPFNPETWRARYTIEDACESIGAKALGLAGTSGTLNTFSLFYSHQLSAIEGGMILTDDDELAMICRMLRDHGATRSVIKAARFEDEYDFRLFGYNLRPVEMHAAIAREQLKKLPELRAGRQKNFTLFREMTGAFPIVIPPTPHGHNPFGLHFTVGSSEVRGRLVTALRGNGIDCRLPTGGSFLRHKYSEPWQDQRTPKADRIHECGLFLGNSGFPIEDKIERAVKVMEGVLR
jgi:CDP-6-deoxy-D-xylo-4-hexulose-3-dehydrase